MNIHKIISIIIICFVLIIALPFPTIAANQVHTVDIQAIIYEDGSMYITQIWEGQFNEGTESYISMNTPDYITISELAVSDKYGNYNTVPDWNINWNFEEKARKCGIYLTDSGYDICFGISKYGQNSYTINYKLDNVVGSYKDRDGVNFRFVNDGMNTTPTDVTVQIRLADNTPITEEIANVWGFGFVGQVVVENEIIIVHTDTPLSTENHVTVLLAMEKGNLSPTRKEPGSFEDVREKAFEGSDYDNKEYNDEEISLFGIIVTILLSFGLPIGLIIWISKFKKKSAEKKLKRLSQKFEYFRELPNEGIISATYVLGKLFNICDDGAILATGILRLIQLGCLIPVVTQEVGLMGKNKETVNLRLSGSNHDKMNEFDEYLYTVLEGAAGSDATLQAQELELYAYNNDTLLRAYIEKHDSVGRTYLIQKNCMNKWNIPANVTHLTLVGKQELGELIGFKRYLEDFSLVAERNIKEIPIWRELLIYAMLFGIADQVAEQMKELYPLFSTELNNYSLSLSTAYSYYYLLYSNMKKAEELHQQETRSSGMGGIASIGGGGGSIGGGSGGGTR